MQWSFECGRYYDMQIVTSGYVHIIHRSGTDDSLASIVHRQTLMSRFHTDIRSHDQYVLMKFIGWVETIRIEMGYSESVDNLERQQIIDKKCRLNLRKKKRLRVTKIIALYLQF